MICTGNTSDSNGVVLVMNELVHCSHCALTSLAIHHPVAFHQLFIKDCLSLMDSLVSLDISPFWNVEVGVLFDALGSPKFLPKLQHLSLRVSFTQDLLWDPLAAMLRTRSQYLSSVKISCGRLVNVNRINDLAPLRPSGLPAVVSVERSKNLDMISCFGKFEYA